MSLLNIPTKSTGDPFSAVELNTIVNAIKELQKETGWAEYIDGQYTSQSPLNASEGVTTQLTNNADTTQVAELPYDVTSFWDDINNKVIGTNSGDLLMIRVQFTAYTDSNQGLAEIDLNVGGAVGVVERRTISFPKGAGVQNARKFSFTSQTPVSDTFVTNGGTFEIIGINGTTSIYDINILVSRIHKTNA